MKDYIAQSLDGMLMQKTDFPFEIIVHDDASTDGSTEILREYAEKYPDIIVPIFQTENQHSKKVKITKTYIIPKIRGKYTAMCEGDDYWTDPQKLQKQYDFMEANPDYTLCAAKIRQVNCSDPTVPDIFLAPIDHTGEITMDEIILQKDKQVFGHCSLFCRSEYLSSRPSSFPPGGDRMLVFWMGINGRVWFINDEVGVYRRARPGSWSERYWENGKKRKIALFMNYISSYMKFDLFTERKYNRSVQEVYLQYMKMILRAGGNYRDITKGELRECYDGLTSDKKRSLLIYKILLPARKAAHWVKTKLKRK